MEIVSRPDLRSSEEAKAYVTKLRTILRYLGTCDGDMEKGNLRADVNVSVRRPASRSAPAARSRTSTRSASSARPSRPRRAARSRSSRTGRDRAGDPPVRPGPGRDPLDALEGRGARLPLLPRPDLLPLEFSQDFVDGLAAGLPELPDAKKARFVADFGLSPYDAGVLVAERASADFYEAVAKGRDGKAAANWVINELFGRPQQGGARHRPEPGLGGPAGQHHRPDRRGHDLGQDRQGPVRDRLDRWWRPARRRRGPRHEAGHRHRRDRGGGGPDHRPEPRQGRAGAREPTLLGWFVGQTMKATGGKANPAAVNALLKAKLGIA